MPVSSRQFTSRFLFQVAAVDGLDKLRAWRTRTGVAGTYVTGAGTEPATDQDGVAYNAAYRSPRANFDFDLSVGTWTHSGRRLIGTLGDLMTFPYMQTPRAMTAYVRFRRSAVFSANALLFGIGGTTGARFLLVEDSAGYSAIYNSGAVAYTSSVVTVQSIDEWVELRATMGATGIVTLYVSRAGATETAGTPSADPGSLAAAWNSTIAYLGANAGPTASATHNYMTAVIGGGALAVTAFRPPWWLATTVAAVTRLSEDGVTRLSEDDITRLSEGV